MKYKKKFNGLIILMLFFTMLILIFTIPFMIQSECYSAAVFSVFFLLFITFAAGYRVAVQDKDDTIVQLINCIKSRITHNVRYDLSDPHLSEEDSASLNKRIVKAVDEQANNYFNIDQD